VNLADSIDGRTNALTVFDVAGLLNISERQVYKLAAENRIPSFKIGGSVRFDPVAFAAWLRQKSRPRRSAPSALSAERVGFPEVPSLEKGGPRVMRLCFLQV
jgi:excisionase family DNA binding protein